MTRYSYKGGDRVRRRADAPRKRRWAPLYAVLALGLGLALVWVGANVLSPTDKIPQPGKRNPKSQAVKSIEQDTPTKSSTSRPIGLATPTKSTTLKNETAKVFVDGREIIPGSYSAKTNFALGTYTERYTTVDGKRHVMLKDMESSVFSSATDQAIALAIAPPVAGGNAPPIPSLQNEDGKFLESLSSPITINEGDSDAVKEVKRTVQEARKQIKDLMASGMTLDAILSEHRELVNQNSRIRREAQKELERIHASGDKEGAQQYFETINAALAEMGIEALERPLTEEEKTQLKDDRRAARKARRSANSSTK